VRWTYRRDDAAHEGEVVNRRTLRWIWFAALFLLAPWPLSGMGDAFVPAVRYAMLAAAGPAVAAAEGAQGPAPLIIGLMCVSALGYTALCFAIASLVARGLERIGRGPSALVTILVLAVALAVAVVGQPYLTPFGHAPRGGLLEILS